MTKKLYSLFAIVAISLLTIISCKKNDSNSNPGPDVSVSVAGRVTDLIGKPVRDATVTSGNKTTITNTNGEFIISNVQLNKDAAIVKVTKTGYFNGSRTFLANGNTTNNVSIQLIPKKTSGNFTASSGVQQQIATTLPFITVMYNCF